MGGNYHAKMAGSGIWCVYGPSGALIGSCGSREGALLLISSVNGGTVEPQAREPEGRAAAAGEGVANSAPEGAAPEANTRAGAKPEKAHAVRPLMFDWYAPRGRSGRRSLLERFYRAVGVRGG